MLSAGNHVQDAALPELEPAEDVDAVDDVELEVDVDVVAPPVEEEELVDVVGSDVDVVAVVVLEPPPVEEPELDEVDVAGALDDDVGVEVEVVVPVEFVEAVEELLVCVAVDD